jgi:foldase protein PrsA
MAKKEKTVQKNISSNLTVKLPKKIFLRSLIFLLILGLIYFSVRFFFAASVNGQLINRFSVIKDLEKQGGKKVLDTIILKTLINQEAKKRKLAVSQKEVDTELKKIESNISSQGSTLDALLVQQGMTKNDLIGEIKLQLLVTKMVDNNISVTDKEIDDYLASQNDQNSLGLTQSTPGLSRVQAETAIKQKKLQEKIQTFVADLKAKAKINYFIKY